MSREPDALDEYETISRLLEPLAAHHSGSVDGPGMCRESTWTLVESTLGLTVVQSFRGTGHALRRTERGTPAGKEPPAC